MFLACTYPIEVILKSNLHRKQLMVQTWFIYGVLKWFVEPQMFQNDLQLCAQITMVLFLGKS